MKLRHWTPLLGFVLPTLIIGYGFVIPRSCIAGVNQLTSALQRRSRPQASPTGWECVAYSVSSARSAAAGSAR